MGSLRYRLLCPYPPENVLNVARGQRCPRPRRDQTTTIHAAPAAIRFSTCMAPDDHPPGDEAGFDAFARSLRDSVLANLIAAGRSAGPIAVLAGTSNRFHHFERIQDRPTGSLLTGEAACAFNPVYGQGVSAAAFAAGTLGNLLRRHRTPMALTRRFLHASPER